MGGEKFGHPKYTTDKGGSPPRGRGKVLLNLLDIQRQRITPAWAGKSGRTSALTRPGRDHPRVGGEKIILFDRWNLGPGSPPRGRGKVDARGVAVQRLRITPAWAGKR